MKKIDDQIRYLLTGIVVFCFAQAVHAELDLGVGGTFRSYPLSGVAEARAGYGISLYGAPGSPFSGFIRPNIEGNSAGTYNSGMAQLEVFPLAFMGVRAGGELVQNDKDYTPYDCELFRCKGRFHRTFFGADLTLGVQGAFVRGLWRRERWSQAKEQFGDFVEPTSGILMRGTGETQTVYYGIAGYKIDETWAVMSGIRYAQDDDSISRMPFGMVRYVNGNFTLGLGAGDFESSLKDRAFTAWGYFSWDIIPSSVHIK